MDNTPPRNRLIAFYSLLAVVTLALLKPAFDAYYDQMFETARTDRLATYDDLGEVQEAERRWAQELDRGPVTIADAMEQLGERGRTALPQIAPQAPAEMNLDPLRGWTQLPTGVELTSPDPVGAVETEGDDLLDTPLEGGEAPPEGAAPAEGEAAPDGAPAQGTVEPAPGLAPGDDAPGEGAAIGQPGAAGGPSPRVVREAVQQERAAPTKQRPAPRPSPEPAADPNEGETE